MQELNSAFRDGVLLFNYDLIAPIGVPVPPSGRMSCDRSSPIGNLVTDNKSAGIIHGRMSESWQRSTAGQQIHFKGN